jgi:GT2 family glycosyltransferase
LCCVVLTVGGRHAELDRAVRSVLAQSGPPIDVLVIGNGTPVPPLPSAVRTLVLPENVGIPGGRNVGVVNTEADVVLFLDDDGWLPSTELAEHLREVFAADHQLGVVSFRIIDPDSQETQRRHVPRVRVGDPRTSSEVTTFLGGACGIRREVFRTAGPLPDAFYYGHEETDLAWRAMDAG